MKRNFLTEAKIKKDIEKDLLKGLDKAIKEGNERDYYDQIVSMKRNLEKIMDGLNALVKTKEMRNYSSDVVSIVPEIYKFERVFYDADDILYEHYSALDYIQNNWKQLTKK